MRSALPVLLAALSVALIGAALWVRLAPSAPARWHIDPDAAPDPGPAGFRRVIETDLPPAETLGRLAAVAEAAPRSRRLAGSPGSGRITWIVRSRLWGFPDYVTAAARPTARGSRLTVLGRLRFGRSDLGVNRKRIEQWIAEALPRPQ